MTRSAKSLELLKKAIRRRTEVGGVHPDDAALRHFSSCVLIETHDGWAAPEYSG